MDEVFGLGLGAGLAESFPLLVFRAFRRAAHDLNWERLLEHNVGQSWIISNSADTHLRMPRFAPKLPHTQNTSTSSLVPTKVHFKERVSVCINIVQPPASCNSMRWFNKRTKIVRHSTLAATMQATSTTFRWTRTQSLARATFCFLRKNFW